MIKNWVTFTRNELPKLERILAFIRGLRVRETSHLKMGGFPACQPLYRFSERFSGQLECRERPTFGTRAHIHLCAEYDEMARKDGREMKSVFQSGLDRHSVFAWTKSSHLLRCTYNICLVQLFRMVMRGEGKSMARVRTYGHPCFRCRYLLFAARHYEDIVISRS